MFSTHAPAAPAAPPGTFAPGTKIQVGSHKVVIQKYFSEGGFAHVYLVKMPEPKDGTDIAVLKRVAVPDKDSLANMRTEVETMKKLKGQTPIVTYYDSHASQLKGGGYEVFLLMEFCNGGGLIDFMNTRLQNRLTEPEILKIFSDVTEGVACMHYLKPPLLHRDLKVENVLISESSRGRRYKLCDFGSTAPPRPAATTAAECRLIEDDVQKHTTLQYRSPEMIDVYRKQPIDEKSDIWALGVLLYKLCYYTTPFEEQGQLAILNASFKYPAHPVFSDRLKKLIASMLRENPKQRPNVYQVLKEACSMQGLDCPIKDIYSHRTESESRRNQSLPSPPNIVSPPTVGAVYSPPVKQQPIVPDVVPMRRGRPTTTIQAPVTKPSPSPMRVVNSDPFAALDSKTPPMSQDEISARFPSLDQFSLLHEQGSKFEFDASSTAPSKPKDLSQRVTEKLADDAFAMPTVKPLPATPAYNPAVKTNSMSRAQQIIAGAPELQAIGQTASKPSSYVSHGTMTSPKLASLDSPRAQQQQMQPPAHRFSQDHHRSSSLSRETMSASPRLPDRSLLGDAPRPHSVSRHSSFQLLQKESRPLSARPSLESSRPSNDGTEPVARTRSTGSRQRPSSAYLESHMDYLREKESGNDQPTSKGNFFTKHMPHSKKSNEPSPHVSDPSRTPSPALSDAAIDSNVEFLKQMEESEKKDSKSKRSSIHKHSKKPSLPSLFVGKFGDAFKRFETNTAHTNNRTPSPLHDGRGLMTPILGSEATDERSDDGRADAMDEVVMSGEQKRELERQRLEDEERRVENAARAYKTQMAEREARGESGRLPSRGMGASKASMIQNKVQSLLNENVRPAEVQRTAVGYGKYTDGAAEQGREADDRNVPDFSAMETRSGTMQQQPKPIVKKAGPPGAPPKPVHLLHTGSSVSGVSASSAPANPYAYASPRSSATKLSQSPPKPAPRQLQQGTMAAQTGGRPGPSGIEPRDGWTAAEKDEHLRNFKQRYPSLSGIEMVETIVGGDGARANRPRGAEV